MDAQADTHRTDGPHPDASTPAELELRAAAVVLGISAEALRKRVSRGTIPARKVAGVWMVSVDPDGRSAAAARTDIRTALNGTHGHATARPRPSIPAIDPADYARAQERISGLEAQLAQAQADRDRWHEQARTAQETYLRDMAAMRELVAREQHIALRATTASDGWTDTGRTDTDVTADGHEATVHAATPATDPRPGSEDPDKRNAEILSGSWRRWWRRMTGGSADARARGRASVREMDT
jgi:hypothetical protein